ncbi:hypothetical protein ACFLXW_00090 [Candidatus Dependentiae bacterium]
MQSSVGFEVPEKPSMDDDMNDIALPDTSKGLGAALSAPSSLRGSLSHSGGLDKTFPRRVVKICLEAIQDSDPIGLQDMLPAIFPSEINTLMEAHTELMQKLSAQSSHPGDTTLNQAERILTLLLDKAKPLEKAHKKK